MENKKTKNHKENWIGNIIRGFLLFMPLLAIGVTCAYAIFNKNAYQSYYGETINESYEVNQQNKEIKTDIDYHLYANRNTTNNINNIILNLTITKINYVMNDNQTNTLLTNFENVTNLYFFVNADVQYIQFRTNTNSIIGSNVNVNTSLIDFEYQYNSSSQSGNLYTFLQNNSYITEYNNLSFVSEVFYYSIERVQESPLFNWSKNTGLYNVIRGACTTLEIQTTFVPFLLSYWLLTYLIYIIYDIALLIVNMAHNRIHDVESSI